MANNFRDTLSSGIENKIRTLYVDRIVGNATKAMEESIKVGRDAAAARAQVDTGFQQENITTHVEEHDNVIVGEIGMYRHDFLGRVRKGAIRDSGQIITTFYPAAIVAGRVAITAGIDVAEQELSSRIKGLK